MFQCLKACSNLQSNRGKNTYKKQDNNHEQDSSWIMNCKGTYKIWHYKLGQEHKKKDLGHDPGWQVVLLMMQEDLYLHYQVNQNPSLSI